MATSYTADDLLEQVRRGGALPSAASTGTLDADLLAHANAELRDTLVPALLGVREEMYQRVFDVAVTAGVAPYRINKRATLSRINTVQWINTDGTGFNLVRYDPKQVADLCLLTTAQGQPFAYYLEGSRVVLYPTPNGTGTLRIRAMVRPSRLCLTTDATACLVISVVTPLTALATEYTTAAHSLVDNAIRDIVAATPSFEHLAVDATAYYSSATTLEFLNAAQSSPAAVGDYICVPDYTPFVQLPVELQPALVELTVARCLRSLGQKSEAADHSAEAGRLVVTGIEALTPRVDSADRKILGGPHYRRSRNTWGLR